MSTAAQQDKIAIERLRPLLWRLSLENQRKKLDKQKRKRGEKSEA